MYKNFKVPTLKCAVVASIISFGAYSQGTVTINPKTQRFVKQESNFKREKYFHIHQLTDVKDKDFIKFKNEFGFAPSYRGSRLLDSALKNHRGTGNFPTVKRKFTGVRPVEDRFTSTSPGQYFYKPNADYSKENMTQYIDRLTTYMRDYYRYEEARVPKYIEPLNEPMIKSIEFVKKGPGQGDRIDVVNTRICELHRELGKKIHAAPQLKNVKVAGFGSAFPAFEKNNFKLWESRYKKFIDIAGKDVDVFTVHLYDGVGVNNEGGRRSGSNVEAILDMIQTYSNIKLNTVRPIAITEFGRLVADQPNFPNPGVRNYEPVENSQALRSQMHMSMAFMERGGEIEYTIPFTMSKQSPTGKFSKSSLWNRIRTNPPAWEYTPRVQFFEIWKGVKGKRVQINSTNIDVQTQALVDGNKMYVILNNLNDNRQTVKLNLTNVGAIQNVKVKRLKVFLRKLPELTEVTRTTPPTEIGLDYGESAVLTYTFNAPIKFNGTATSKKYYTKKYLQPIKANAATTFNFGNVATGRGSAKLRVGVGRALKASFKPVISINGNKVNLPQDIIRGYNQRTRDQFFGTLEIPFNTSFLKAGANAVTVTFPDNGGFVTSVILQVETIKSDVVAVDSILFASLPTQLTSSDSYEFDVNYEASVNRDVVVAIFDDAVFKGSGKVTVSPGSGSAKVTVNLGADLPPGTNYIIRAMIREVGGDFSTNKDIVQATNVEVIENTLSTEDFDVNGKNSFQVFPNPVTNQLNVTIEGAWSIFSVSGRNVLQGNSKKIDVSSLSNGIYFFKLENSVLKFIKE
ncbi:T9SS type A sorting domain-containing protein [Aquimarina sp. ERC-38]|uniref:T9SS type A sorting domain-containing protein n=1 Tax=Aquimarina sp. ERC-38 TaxID=2949996 RepID=UPI002245609C|nr:T9SS type A sorting domain-containing protein [Aquimarina sp. ERC-38]UZO79462.1 T9SS type A sorting domain-containing protein [Aquimarina sp. ERC-38]